MLWGDYLFKSLIVPEGKGVVCNYIPIIFSMFVMSKRESVLRENGCQWSGCRLLEVVPQFQLRLGAGENHCLEMLLDPHQPEAANSSFVFNVPWPIILIPCHPPHGSSEIPLLHPFGALFLQDSAPWWEWVVRACSVTQLCLTLRSHGL